MDRLILEDFRCFAGRSEVPIRPLTVLVGENSTGKTSFLAAARAAHDAFFRAVPDFNEDPFRLGSYDQIANYRQRRAKSFVVGQEFTTVSPRVFRTGRTAEGQTVRLEPGTAPETTRLETRFHASKSQPAISSVSASCGPYTLNAAFEDGKSQLSFLLNEEVVGRRETDMDLHESALVAGGLQFMFYRGHSEAQRTEEDEHWAEHEEHFDSLASTIAFFRGPRPYAFAPIRTSPQRTYDPTTEVRDAEGGHIPMMLQRLLDTDDVGEFRGRLEEFGEASGLYSSLRVRKLGRRESNPFQVEVKHPRGGRARNLVDVGYGVSQAIPIIADCVSAEPESTLLIQQPEVHLHPRAQAAMGSFFAQLAKSRRNRVIVETHSDYLLDRIRIDVREERIRCGDVGILYFEQRRTGVRIHPIELDAMGNLKDVPDGYRRFFLEEQRRFLGID